MCATILCVPSWSANVDAELNGVVTAPFAKAGHRSGRRWW